MWSFALNRVSVNPFAIHEELWCIYCCRPQRPVRQSFDVFFDLHLNKWLRKQSRRQWLETPPRSLWRHCNDWGFPYCRSHLQILCLSYPYTVWCHYNAVSFLQNPHKVHPHKLPMRVRYGVSLMSLNSYYILLKSLQCFMQYHVILDRVIMAPDCIFNKIICCYSHDWNLWFYFYIEYAIHFCQWHIWYIHIGYGWPEGWYVWRRMNDFSMLGSYITECLVNIPLEVYTGWETQ